MAAFENPMLHNLVVDLGKYPEIRRALATGEVVLVRDATTDPHVRAFGPGTNSMPRYTSHGVW